MRILICINETGLSNLILSHGHVVKVEVVHPPQEVHERVGGEHELERLRGSVGSEVSHCEHVGGEEAEAAHVEPGRVGVRRPRVGWGGLEEPRVEEAAEGPRPQPEKDAQGA